MRRIAALAVLTVALLSVGCLGPDRERVACGDDPFVLIVEGEMSSWNAEAGADWLRRQPPDVQDFWVFYSGLIDRFERGQQITLVRHSDRFGGLALVQHFEDMMWTTVAETGC